MPKAVKDKREVIREAIRRYKDPVERGAYKKEGAWGSYNAPHFNGGIHGLPHVRPPAETDPPL
jgi:hypothetical protein